MRVLKLFGPPGTGKTRALLDLLERELANGVEPERVAFMTFTVVARREAVTRVQEKFGFDRDRLPYFRTIHSLAFRQLEASRSMLVTPDKLQHLGLVTSLEFSKSGHDFEDDFPHLGVHESAKVGDRLIVFDHLRRHLMSRYEDALAEFDIDINPHVARYFTDAYARWKRDEGLYDFTDLLTDVDEPLDVDVVFIDEAQDLSPLQWRAVRVLSANAERGYVAGDDDQAIFTWAGARPRLFIDLACEEFRVLDQSYRVPRKVAKVAEFLSSNIRHRQPKFWRPRDADGSVGSLEYVETWDPFTEGTTHVLYRNHYLAQEFIDRLHEVGVPYKKMGEDETSVSRWARPIVLWERQRRGHALTKDELDEVSRAQMPGAVVDRGAPWFEALTRISPRECQYLRNVLARFGNDGLLKPPRVTLSTIHGSKGAQADHVVIHAGMSKRCESAVHASDDEVRVIYVGVTRARETLTIVGGDHPLIPRDLLK